MPTRIIPAIYALSEGVTVVVVQALAPRSSGLGQEGT